MDMQSFQQGLYNMGPSANTDWNAYHVGRTTREWNENARKALEQSCSPSAPSSIGFDWTFPSPATSSSAYSGSTYSGTGAAGGGHWVTIVALLVGLAGTVIGPLLGFNAIGAGITATILTVLLILGVFLIVALLKVALGVIAWLLAPWRWSLPLALLGAAVGFGFQATAGAPATAMQQTASFGAGAGAVLGFIIGAAVRRFRRR